MTGHVTVVRSRWRRVRRWIRLQRFSVQDRIVHALDHGHRHGVDIMRAYGLHPGQFYPVMLRLERGRMVVGAWDETVTPHRRAYRLNWITQAYAYWRQIDPGYRELSAVVSEGDA